MANEKTVKEKILVIDDDEIHLEFAELMLHDEYDIYKAKSGKDALQILFNNGFIPNLILLDILMPHMDGWEAFHRIKAISVLHNVPIIFLTSISEMMEEKRAFEMGAADYITKPYNKKDLKRRIKEVLNKHAANLNA